MGFRKTTDGLRVIEFREEIVGVYSLKEFNDRIAKAQAVVDAYDSTKELKVLQDKLAELTSAKTEMEKS